MKIRNKLTSALLNFFAPSYCWLFVVGCCLLFVAAHSVQAQPSNSCSYPNLVEWPTKNPVWKLCWVDPAKSSGINASGLEIRNVRFRDQLVMSRGHIPVLNVKYKQGGCGGPHLSYRDWLGDAQFFAANNVIRPGYAEPTTPPVTACELPGRDAGEFKGVAVEMLADRLVLTTQMKSAWYRYIIKWIFYADGTIEPRIGFSAVDYFCTTNPHTHHAFWRFDIDLADAENDLIEESNNDKWLPLGESERLKDSAANRSWRVRDTVKNTALEITPGANDAFADKFAVADFWALAYNQAELDDGGAVRGRTGDQAQMSKYINGEPINNGKSNVVIWYRSGTTHNGDGNRCDTVGPTLKVSNQK